MTTKLRNPPVVESGFGLRKANASFVTVDVFWYLTCSSKPSLFSLSKRSKEDQQEEGKKRSEYFNACGYSTSRKAKNRSIDRRISGPGVCERVRD